MSDRTKLSEALESWDVYRPVISDGARIDLQPIVDAARRFLALLPDDDGNYDEGLLDEMAKTYFYESEAWPNEAWETFPKILREDRRRWMTAVLRAITGTTE